MTDVSDDLHARLSAFVGRSYGPYRAWDPVNAPMIRQWREAITVGNDDEDVDSDTAPRTMINVWMMRGVADKRPADSTSADPYELVQMLRDEGHVGVVATQCRQDYVRDLKAGERLESMVVVDRVSGLKQTGLGAGYFVSLRHEYLVAGEPVGSMLFTTLHYAPRPKAESRPAPPQPGISDDTRFFWDGLEQDRLLAQKCDSCGTLRHPPGPVCTKCHSLDWHAEEMSGRGALHSWTVVHHAAHPAFDYPHPIGLIDLDEGIRMIAPLKDVAPEQLADGLRLWVAFQHVPGEQRLPAFRPEAD